MNIEYLKTFCLIVEEGSFSQAARLSYVSQPAVTRQIHNLEKFYGTLLFLRDGGKLQLTEAGKKLYPFAKSIVQDFYRSKETIQQLNQQTNYTLKVGASFAIGEILLPRLLGEYKKLNPTTNITMQIKNTPSILEDLENDDIDIAFVEGIVENNDFIVEKFRDDQLILVCHNDHPWDETIPIDELANEQMIWREEISGTRIIIENVLKEHDMLEKIESYMELGSLQAIKSAVEAGLGISILPKIVVERELQMGIIKEINIENVHISRPLWRVQKDNKFPKNSLTDFLQFLKARQQTQE